MKVRLPVHIELISYKWGFHSSVHFFYPPSFPCLDIINNWTRPDPYMCVYTCTVHVPLHKHKYMTCTNIFIFMYTC